MGKQAFWSRNYNGLGENMNVLEKYTRSFFGLMENNKVGEWCTTDSATLAIERLTEENGPIYLVEETHKNRRRFRY